MTPLRKHIAGFITFFSSDFDLLSFRNSALFLLISFFAQIFVIKKIILFRDDADNIKIDRQRTSFGLL
jgi:hypothetical protein